MSVDEKQSASVLVLATRVDELSDALARLVKVIESAGITNLANGVQLGQTSWYIKCSDAVNYANSLLGDAP